MGQGVRASRFEDEGLLVQASITGEGREPGRSISHISAETIKSFRESRSFRYAAVSSATSSPAGYITKNQIDPATHSFTEALRAIQQTRCGSGRKSMVPIRFFEGKILNSKWDDAEKYISNPLSGEVPIECLSSFVASKTLAEYARITPSLAGSTSKSAPLTASTSYGHIEPLPVITIPTIQDVTSSDVGQLRRRNGSWMRDVGTQITPLDCSSSSPSITSAPIQDERSEGFRLMGRRCFIFQMKPTAKVAEEEFKEDLMKENQEKYEQNWERKKVKAIFAWKLVWLLCSCNQERKKKKKKREEKARYKPQNGKARKDLTIITLRATQVD